MTFSPNSPLKAATASSDGEPSSRVDSFGNYYVCGIRGVPAGVDLWYFDLRPTVGGSPNPNYDPNMRVPIYRGQPDSTIPNTGGVAAGAWAVAISTWPLALVLSPALGGTGEPALAYASLPATNVTGRSLP